MRVTAFASLAIFLSLPLHAAPKTSELDSFVLQATSSCSFLLKRTQSSANGDFNRIDFHAFQVSVGLRVRTSRRPPGSAGAADFNVQENSAQPQSTIPEQSQRHARFSIVRDPSDERVYLEVDFDPKRAALGIPLRWQGRYELEFLLNATWRDFVESENPVLLRFTAQSSKEFEQQFTENILEQTKGRLKEWADQLITDTRNDEVTAEVRDEIRLLEREAAPFDLTSMGPVMMLKMQEKTLEMVIAVHSSELLN